MPKIAAPILFRWLSSFLVLSSGAVVLVGCVAAPPPYEEYTLARAAIRAAQDVDSARFATNYWNKADDIYRQGQKAYKDADFDVAKARFNQAKQLAERAENMTRLKKFETGEGFP